MAPHWLQHWLVKWGSTKTTARPALAALATQRAWKCPQPASSIDVFKPALAAAPLGRYCPLCSGSGLGSGALLIWVIFKSSKTIIILPENWLSALSYENISQ
jgi:hypothetical protein